MRTDNPGYQPEIDGLRAIAVLAVVLFHAEFRWIPGGYVGVDVFFVISGFLITRILVRDVRQRQFSFSAFYLRRLRRLGPALLATLLLTFIVALLFLTPHHFQRFSGALIASVFSVSNLYFWAESGYFDASADLKPLLHTWSLSVEEQFYLVWPALIVLLAMRARWVLPLVLAGLSLASLYGALLLTSIAPSASFFLMPFRIYEFGVGAGLALLPSLVQRNVTKELLCLLGLAMIAWSVFEFDKYTPFPDIYALLPCMGAALLIAGGSARGLGLLLRNPLSVWLGRISYSLYLVHWPIVVLYKHITFEDVIVGKTRIALLLLTIIVAWLMYHMVERRFRFAAEHTAERPRWRRLAWMLMPAALTLGSAHAWVADGWTGRFDADVIAAIGNIDSKQLERRRYIDADDALSNLPFDATAERRVLVMGDSHATDMFNALYLNLAEDTRVSVRRLELDDVCLYLFSPADRQDDTHLSANEIERCRQHFDAVQRSALPGQADRIVMSTRWERSSLPHLQAFADFLHSRGPANQKARLVIMGRTAEFRNVPSLILKNGLAGNIDEQLAEARFRELDTLNEQIAGLAMQLGLAWVDKLPFLCEDPETRCQALDASGKVLYTDYGHWTLEGARVFGQRMLGQPDTAERLTGFRNAGQLKTVPES